MNKSAFVGEWTLHNNTLSIRHVTLSHITDVTDTDKYEVQNHNVKGVSYSRADRWT